MIIDGHYHYMPAVSDEAAQRLVKYVLHQAEILGIEADTGGPDRTDQDEMGRSSR